MYSSWRAKARAVCCCADNADLA